VDFKEIAAAFKDNLKKKRIRGGSTITQQLAKNLFLTRDKNFMRKLKEMVLAIELDATFSKMELLEIYFNIIEWGPKIRGITHASDHYFGKSPEDLTVLEAAYLVSIIPNPVKYYTHYIKDTVSNGWRNRVNKIIELLYMHDYITDEQYQVSASAPIFFYKP